MVKQSIIQKMNLKLLAQQKQNDLKQDMDYSKMGRKSEAHLFKQMSHEEAAEYKQLFQLFAEFDTDGSQTISVEEWRQAMKRFGHDATQQQAQEMLKQNGIQLNGQINFYEFIGIINKKKREIMGQESVELAKAFRLFDKDLDGVLSAKELQAGLQRLGESMRLQDLQLLVSMADKDSDGSINFQEFSRIMTLK